MKIVSLLPSATEVVWALGLGDDLVGVSHECDHPPEARAKRVVSTTSLPDVGSAPPEVIDRLVSEKLASGESLYQLDVDALQQIDPDLVLVQDLCPVCAVASGDVLDALQRAGAASSVLSLDPHNLADVFDSIVEVGRRAEAEAAATQLVSSLRGRVEAVRRLVGGRDRVRVVSLEWPNPPFVGGHWVPDMVDAAGGEDLLGVTGGASRRVTWDEIEEANPDVIVYMPCGYFLQDAIAQIGPLYDNSAVASTEAGRLGRIYATDASAYFSRPGPRLVDGIEALAWMLHPDVAAEPPPGRAQQVSRV